MAGEESLKTAAFWRQGVGDILSVLLFISGSRAFESLSKKPVSLLFYVGPLVTGAPGHGVRTGALMSSL